jgi:hypothetical protein
VRFRDERDNQREWVAGERAGRDNATGLANREEAVPAMGSYDAAPVGSKEARLEIERAEKVAGWVRERDGGGPSNELQRIRDRSGREELDITKIHNAVMRADGKPVPLRPPMTQRVAHGLVWWALKEKVDVVDAGCGTVITVRGRRPSKWG